MNTSTILLATLFEHKDLYKICIGNYKYIAHQNALDYNKKLYSLSEILDNNYSSTICMNHFSVFLKKNIDPLLQLLDNDVNIILPINSHMPLELIPFYIKNSAWSKKFIELYVQSKCYNTYSFISNFYNFDQPEILINDTVISDKLNKNGTIVERYISMPIDAIKQTTNHRNVSLGIL
jgi:hypothetical protein